MSWQRSIINFPRKIIIFLIVLYQKTISPDHGIFKFRHPFGYCRFYPSCSQYSKQAIEKYGIFKGGAKAGKRIIKCNPFNKGGFDPVK